jgi:hypothetical protein
LLQRPSTTSILFCHTYNWKKEREVSLVLFLDYNFFFVRVTVRAVYFCTVKEKKNMTHVHVEKLTFLFDKNPKSKGHPGVFFQVEIRTRCSFVTVEDPEWIVVRTAIIQTGFSPHGARYSRSCY